MTTVLSTKGQVIIPKEVRRRLGWTPGTELEVEDRPDSIVIRARGEVASTKLEDVLGCLAYRGRPRSIAEMDAAVARLARKNRPRRRRS